LAWKHRRDRNTVSDWLMPNEFRLGFGKRMENDGPMRVDNAFGKTLVPDVKHIAAPSFSSIFGNGTSGEGVRQQLFIIQKSARHLAAFRTAPQLFFQRYIRPNSPAPATAHLQ